MLTIVASVNSSDNAIIAFEGGRPVDQLGHDTWSCRCLEETEDDGEDWSNWTQRWLRDISWQSPLGSEGQSAVSLEVHTAHPAGSMVGQERLVLPPMVGGAGSHVSMLLYVTGGAARVVLVGLCGIVHLPHDLGEEFVHHGLTFGWRLHEGAAPLLGEGPALVGGHLSLTFQVYFVPHQDDRHFLIPRREQTRAHRGWRR